MTESITSAITDNAPTPTESVVAAVAEPKLWAGKYKTAEEMEAAIVGKDKEYSKLSSEHREILNKYETFTKVPDDYILPNDVNLREAELAEIKQIAKNANLTQEHFAKVAKEMEARLRSSAAMVEENKKEIGNEKLILLEDHVKKHYPEQLHQVIINQALKDKEALGAIMSERDNKLNSQAPGMSTGNVNQQPAYDGQRELEKAAIEYNRQPNLNNKKRYMNLLEEVGRERFKK